MPFIIQPDPLKPPSNEQLERWVGKAISRRELIRETGISVVERIYFSSGTPETVVLKTTLYELQAEWPVHRFVSNLPINAASFIQASLSTISPWLLTHDIGQTSNLETAEPSTDDIGLALEMLAEAHALSRNWTELERLIPDRSISSIKHDIIPTAKKALKTIGQSINADVEAKFHAGLNRANSELANTPLTLVHGDFDPGNLVYTQGRWRALDWGLAHRNVPLVDIAHMVMRFDEPTRSKLVDRYFKAASNAGLDFHVSDSPQELIEAANIAHMAFFVRWHSRPLLDYRVGFEGLVDTIKARMDQIASYGDQ